MSSALINDLLGVLDELSGGIHAGFRPAHAKGLMCIGTFSPSSEAAGLTRAPHANRSSTPVTVRYSDSTGIPTIADNDPARSGPRGIAVRFHLADHVHTDIVAHSTNGFPVRTDEEFLEFLRAAAAGEQFGIGLRLDPLQVLRVDVGRPPVRADGDSRRVPADLPQVVAGPSIFWTWSSATANVKSTAGLETTTSCRRC